MSQNASHLRHVVTAVVVAHDGARLLPGLIKAIQEQTHPVDHVVGVDTGSRDRSGATLTELLGAGSVFGMDPGTGYGAAVSTALQHPAPRGPASGPGPGQDAEVEWIWLLHDDCEPAVDALEQMLRAASRGRSTAVLGPKLRDLTNRRVLREAGVTADRAGRRFTGIEPGEIDQGQHDGNRPVLAVSSAGMLVRRDVWDRVGGFDANLPLFRDDIDFCWRVHAAGYDVRVVTDAVVYHRELSARQVRAAPAAGGHPRLLDRRGALYVFAVNVPLPAMLAVVGGCVAGSLSRAAYFFLTKQQRRAADHLGAVGWLLGHPVTLWRARRRRAAGRKQAWTALHGQLPRGRTLSRLAEAAAGLLTRGPGYESGGLHQAVIGESDDEMPMPAADSAFRRVLTNPGVLLCAGLTLIALVAERSLVGSVLTGSGTLAGGALVPAWGGASDLWREYLAGYHDAGIGSTASAPPYLGVVALLATVLAGKPWLAVDVLLLGCVPAAGVTAFLATRRITSVTAARVWIAATYALLPVAMGAVATGRVGTAVAFVLLPLIGITLERMVSGPPTISPSSFTARRAAWAAGLLIAVAAAFVPLIWLIAVAAALGATAARRWLGRATAVNAAIAAAVPAVLLIPWTFHLLTSPSAFVLEAGLARPGLAAAGLRPESVLLLSPGGPGLPPAWVTAGLVVPAFCALLARRRLALVYAGWGIALSALTVALVVSRVQVTPPQGGPAVSAWPGIALAIAAVGLLLAATPAVEAAAGAFRRTSVPAAGPTPRADWRRLALLGGLVAVSAPLLAAGYWLTAGVRGPVTAAGPQILPAFVAASASGPDRSRTLVLRRDGGALSYAVLRDTDPVLGEPELNQTSAGTLALDNVVASLAAAAGGDGGNTGQALSRFDIGYVLLPAPVDQSLAHQLDEASGLIQLTKVPAYDLWQVAGTVARVRVISADGTAVPVPSGPIGVQADIPAGESGTLVLAEAAGGWSATLNGRPLAKLAEPVDGWAQGFVLPAGGGRLVITRDETARDLALACEALAVLVVVALALPGTSAAVPVTAPEAEAGPDPEAAPAPGRLRERVSGLRLSRRQRRPEPATASIAQEAMQAAAVAEEAGQGTAEAARAEVASGARASSGRPHPFSTVPEPPAVVSTGHRDGDGHAHEPAVPPTAGAASGPSRRPRVGQHAARHSKRRRWRGSPVPKPAASPSGPAEPRVTTDPDGPSADLSPERLDPVYPTGTGSRPPWELGDRS